MTTTKGSGDAPKRAPRKRAAKAAPAPAEHVDAAPATVDAPTIDPANPDLRQFTIQPVGGNLQMRHVTCAWTTWLAPVGGMDTNLEEVVAEATRHLGDYHA